MTTATRNEAAEWLRDSMADLAVTADKESFLVVLDEALAAERRATVDACREFIADFSAAWTGRHVQNRRALDRADLLAAFDERFLP